MFTVQQNFEAKVTSLEMSLDLPKIVQAIRDDALAQARSRLSPLSKNLPLEKLFLRQNFFNSFKFELAKGVSKVIGEHNSYVIAIYIFDPYLNPDAETEDDLPLDAGIHLIIVLRSSSPDLYLFIANIDRALAELLHGLPSIFYKEGDSIIDTIFISWEDIVNHKGNSSLLTSIFSPPTRIWKKEN